MYNKFNVHDTYIGIAKLYTWKINRCYIFMVNATDKEIKTNVTNALSLSFLSDFHVILIRLQE